MADAKPEKPATFEGQRDAQPAPVPAPEPASTEPPHAVAVESDGNAQIPANNEPESTDTSVNEVPTTVQEPSRVEKEEEKEKEENEQPALNTQTIDVGEDDQKRDTNGTETGEEVSKQSLVDSANDGVTGINLQQSATGPEAAQPPSPRPDDSSSNQASATPSGAAESSVDQARPKIPEIQAQTVPDLGAPGPSVPSAPAENNSASESEAHTPPSRQISKRLGYGQSENDSPSKKPRIEETQEIATTEGNSNTSEALPQSGDPVIQRATEDPKAPENQGTSGNDASNTSVALSSTEKPSAAPEVSSEVDQTETKDSAASPGTNAERSEQAANVTIDDGLAVARLDDNELPVDSSDVLNCVAGFERRVLGSVIYTPGELIFTKFDGHFNGVVQVRVSRRFLSRTHPPVARRQLWGTDVYTDDSDIVATLFHRGELDGDSEDAKVVELTNGSEDLLVDVLILPALRHYAGSYATGLNSRSWPGTHDGTSFQILKVATLSPGTAEWPVSDRREGTRVMAKLYELAA